MEEVNADYVKYSIESGGRNDFSNTEIIGDLFINLQHNKPVVLEHTRIVGKFVINAPDYIGLGLKGAFLGGKVTLNIRRGNINISDATFKSGLCIRASEQYSLNMANSKLEGVVDISNSKLSDIDMSNVEFSGSVEGGKFIFEHCEVENKSNISKSVFHNAVFNNTHFKSNVNFDNTKFRYSVSPDEGNFINCIFESDSYWNNVDFEKGCFFKGSIFKGSALFVGVNNGSFCVGDFSGVTFYKRVVFDNSAFSKIAFNNCEFADMVSFKGVRSGFLEISKAVFLKGSDFLNAKIGNADKETFRIIKNEFLKINNQIESLHYRSKEMAAYEREFKGTKITTEKAMLWLNRMSNEHGLNWWSGVKFTVITGLLFYVAYLFLGLKELPFQWGWVDWDSFVKASGTAIKFFIKFFIPTHDLDFMNEFRPNAAGFIIDFLGRIFVGYGIYQTIQAFRKFGKG